MSSLVWLNNPSACFNVKVTHYSSKCCWSELPKDAGTKSISISRTLATKEMTLAFHRSFLSWFLSFLCWLFVFILLRQSFWNWSNNNQYQGNYLCQRLFQPLTQSWCHMAKNKQRKQPFYMFFFLQLTRILCGWSSCSSAHNSLFICISMDDH